MTNDSGSTPEGTRFSRRQVFQYSGLTAAAIGGASLLEGCGGSSSSGQSYSGVAL